MQAARTFGHFAITTKLTHCLDTGIDSGDTKVFTFSFIRELCRQCAKRKNIRKNRDKIKALGSNAFLHIRNAGIVYAMPSAFQLLGQSKRNIHVGVPIQRSNDNGSHEMFEILTFPTSFLTSQPKSSFLSGSLRPLR